MNLVKIKKALAGSQGVNTKATMCMDPLTAPWLLSPVAMTGSFLTAWLPAMLTLSHVTAASPEEHEGTWT